MSWDKESKRYRGARAEWERLVKGNRGLQRELRTLITGYGYTSLSEDRSRNQREIYRWLDTTDPETMNRFYLELDEIADRHEIPPRVKSELLSWFIFDFHAFNLEDSVIIRLSPKDMNREILIGMRADLDDPINRAAIRWAQKKSILDSDPPPSPKGTPGNSKYDWRPVREWYERNSVIFTIDELADLLSLEASYVRRKLSEVASPE